MPIRPRAILLDLDGTLADSIPVMHLAYRRFLEGFGIAATDAEFASLNGPPLPEVVRRLKLWHALPDDEQALLGTYMTAIDQVYVGVAVCPGARELLNRARENRCAVGVVTSNSAQRANAWLASTGLSDWIDFIVSGDDVRLGKPDPEPYLMAIERAPGRAAEMVAVEDSPQGARSAVAAGLHTFVLTREPGADSWPPGVAPLESLDLLATHLW